VGDVAAGTEESTPSPKARAGGGSKLVIVESPTKARTIAGYLGKGYVVESSIGHIRDMPDKAAEIPTKYRNEAWARLGVNVDHDFRSMSFTPTSASRSPSSSSC
jgi:DNA topoisomerase-1